MRKEAVHERGINMSRSNPQEVPGERMSSGQRNAKKHNREVVKNAYQH
jgi:hypothetical protein